MFQFKDEARQAKYELDRERQAYDNDKTYRAALRGSTLKNGSGWYGKKIKRVTANNREYYDSSKYMPRIGTKQQAKVARSLDGSNLNEDRYRTRQAPQGIRSTYRRLPRRTG